MKHSYVTTLTAASRSIGLTSSSAIGNDSKLSSNARNHQLSIGSNEPGGIADDHEFTPEATPEVSPEPLPLTASTLRNAVTVAPAPEYLPLQPVSPQEGMHTIPRYTMNPFRTPQLPRTPRLPSSGFSSHSSPTSHFK